MGGELKEKVAQGVAWSMAEKIGSMLLAMAVRLVILRLLTRDILGFMSIPSAVVTVLLVIVDSGFSQSLVRHKGPSQSDYKSVFLFNIAVSAVLYGVLVALAPLAARWYGMPEIARIAPVFFLLLPLNALCAAKEILVPLQCEFFALEGIVKLLQTYEQVKKRLNPQLGLLGVVLTMFDGRNRLTRQVQDEVNRCFPEQIFKTVIPRTVRLSEAPSFGKSILHYDIKSKGSEAYLSLAKEIVMRKPGSRTAKAE